jgi:glucose/arabinose dehydrogenase
MNPCWIVRHLLVVCAAPVLLSCGGGGGDTGSVGSAVSNGSSGASPVTITAPANFASGLTGVLAISATGSGSAGITRVELDVDGIAVGTDDSAPYTASVDTSAFASGQHIVRARPTDAAGNALAPASVTVQFGGNQSAPAGFIKNDGFATQLNSATAMVQAPDGRLFIAEQGGAVRVFKSGLLLAQPFVQLSVDASGERGLIGITLDPNFPTTPYVYVHYTTPAGGAHNRISRFSTQGDVANTAVGEQILVDLPPLSNATNHNGGALHFGGDGKLYVGVGENAAAERAQDLTSPFGKLLRFNADGSIPADNPFFTTQTGLARAIWAYGLRNPFTFAVQPGTGRIHINDVGANTWEEINVAAAGANFGWPGSEGPDNLRGTVVTPLFAYPHSATTPPGAGPGGFFTGQSIAGGAFYPTTTTTSTGNFPPPYRGSYFFADFVNRFVARLDPANGNAAYAFASLSDFPVDMLVATDGALLVLGRSSVTRISAP